MRACTTLPPGNEAAIRDTVQDLAISSRASYVEEGSSTIPSGSRAQASPKCAATYWVEDIVRPCRRRQETERERLGRNTSDQCHRERVRLVRHLMLQEYGTLVA